MALQRKQILAYFKVNFYWFLQSYLIWFDILNDSKKINIKVPHKEKVTTQYLEKVFKNVTRNNSRTCSKMKMWLILALDIVFLSSYHWISPMIQLYFWI